MLDIKRHFQKVNAVKGHSRPFAAWFKDGDYTLTILRVEVRRNDRGVFFIVEFLIESARAINAHQTNSVGERVSICHNVERNDQALPNVVEFIAAAVGSPFATEAKIKDTIEQLTADDQPSRGMRIGGRTFRKERFNGDDFLGVNFYRVEEHDPAEVFNRRLALDAKGL